MKRELSSKQTFLLKIILPIIIGINFVLMLVLIAANIRTNAILPLLIVPILLAAGIYVMSRTTMRYKKVSIDDEFLYVSNYRNEIKIPLSNISDVTEIKWTRTRPITIHLKNDSEFGRKIVFTSKMNGFRIFADNPIVAELKELANFNKKMNDKKVKQYVFKFECDEVWETLTETENENVRHCQRCDKNVYSVQSPEEFNAKAEKGNCVFSLPMRTAGIPFMPDESEK